MRAENVENGCMEPKAIFLALATQRHVLEETDVMVLLELTGVFEHGVSYDSFDKGVRAAHYSRPVARGT